ncbi:Trehalose-6-P synthase/phosphatase complex synthase subunit [Balamuthia mandrillaris]
MEPAEQEKRLLIVSNRLPLTCKKDPKTESWSFARSSGGLVAALSGLSYSRFIWIGWPGIHIDNEEERREIEKELLEKHSCMPVWLPADIMDKYYNGFCNG